MQQTPESPEPTHALPEDAGSVILKEHREIWSKKPALRRVYEFYFRTILDACGPTRPIVELGSGPGFLKAFCPEIIATDISPTPWIDAVVDGCRLPYRDESVGNIVMMDVFHHIAKPMAFLTEASRVLTLGGRIVMLEPWTSPLGYLFYRYIHHEGADRNVNPQHPFACEKLAFDGNAALPKMFFARANVRDDPTVAFTTIGLRVRSLKSFPAASWLLTGGFRPYGLLPVACVPLARCLDALLSPVRILCALRAIIVLERTTSSTKTQRASDVAPGTRRSIDAPVFPHRHTEHKKA